MKPLQKLILLFIYSDFATNQYGLIRIIDRANYDKRGSFGEDINELKNNELISISKFANNETELGYTVTERGKIYIKETLDDYEIINYVSSMINPDHITKITKALIERKNAS